MKFALTAGALFLALGATLSAHRLDEYLQSTLFTVEKNHLAAQVRLMPGVAVFPAVFASIDTDGDGVLSAAEQRAYAERVLGDLSLTVDGVRVEPRLVSVEYPKVSDMKEGLGEITLQIAADLKPGGPRRKLVFENRHQSKISVYLVNCLVPRDPEIRLVSQDRNFQQSVYQLAYEQGDSAAHFSLAGWSGFGLWMGAAALLLSTRFALRSRQRA